ncbi:MAG: hypothetical protein ACRCZP_11005 [Phycicoccus sp.]
MSTSTAPILRAGRGLSLPGERDENGVRSWIRLGERDYVPAAEQFRVAQHRAHLGQVAFPPWAPLTTCADGALTDAVTLVLADLVPVSAAS